MHDGTENCPRPGRPLRSRAIPPILVALSVVSFAAAAGGCGEPAAGVSGPQASAPEALEEGGRPAQAAGAEGTEGAETAQRGSEAPSVRVSIEPWEQIVAAATAEGRPAVIDIWSLSCEPCIKAFPDLVRLHSELGERVKCVSANVDFDGRRTRPPESYENRVRSFLQLHRSSLANYISATPSDEVYAEVNIPSIPAVLVFDADGNEAARFVDAGETIGFTYRDDVAPFVRGLLAGESTSLTGEDSSSTGEQPSAADGTGGDDRPNL